MHWPVIDDHLFFFFFQAEDGIRDVAETGVQTCALPIWRMPGGAARMTARSNAGRSATVHSAVYSPARPAMSRYGSPSWRRKLRPAASGARPIRPSRSPEGLSHDS